MKNPFLKKKMLFWIFYSINHKNEFEKLNLQTFRDTSDTKRTKRRGIVSPMFQNITGLSRSCCRMSSLRVSRVTLFVSSWRVNESFLVASSTWHRRVDKQNGNVDMLKISVSKSEDLKMNWDGKQGFW